MAESKLVQLNYSNGVYSIIFMYSVWQVLISNLVVVNLFMHLLPGMILLYLAASFLHDEDVFA